MSLAFCGFVSSRRVSLRQRHRGHRSVLADDRIQHRHALLLSVAITRSVAQPERFAHCIAKDVSRCLCAINAPNAQVDEEHVALTDLTSSHMLHTLHGRVGAAQGNNAARTSGHAPGKVQLGGRGGGVHSFHLEVSLCVVGGCYTVAYLLQHALATSTHALHARTLHMQHAHAARAKAHAAR